ncbi:hypothetical protein CEXT_265621 [Caerostris extrusa]|uniref:Uncharacterized protein n=1 Tax=Caerostris extrusa TaxID=172846 RepID=A0AAV4TA65_CAEEX|nr:hypothetical protein CEXT_265621 [Caerostris extrusa]
MSQNVQQCLPPELIIQSKTLFSVCPRLQRDPAIKSNPIPKKKKKNTTPNILKTKHLSEPQNLLCVRVKVGTVPGVNKRHNLTRPNPPPPSELIKPSDSTWRLRQSPNFFDFFHLAINK